MWQHVKSCKFVGDENERQNATTKANLIFYSNSYCKGGSLELKEMILIKMNHDKFAEERMI